MKSSVGTPDAHWRHGPCPSYTNRAVGYNWSTGTHEPSAFVSKLLLCRREFYEKYRHDERMKLTDIV